MDIITNFNVKLDMIDLTGIGGHFGTPAALGATTTTIGASSIGWQVSGGNTFVYVNSGNRKRGAFRREHEDRATRHARADQHQLRACLMLEGPGAAGR